MTEADDHETPAWRRSVPWWQRGGKVVSKYELTAAVTSLQDQIDELHLQVERLTTGRSEEGGPARPG